MAHDVFVSYSSPDKWAADAACATLEHASIRCWIAPRDIRPHQGWDESIVWAIDQCRVMVLIFSANTNRSQRIEREVSQAVDRGIPIVVFRVENVRPSGMLEHLTGRALWLDAFMSHRRPLRQLAEVVEDFLRLAAASFPEAVPSPPPEDVAPPVPRPRYLADGELLWIAQSRRRLERIERQFGGGGPRFYRAESTLRPSPAWQASASSSTTESRHPELEMSAPRSLRGGSHWFLLACAAAVVAGAVFYRHEIGTFLGWLAKSLFHSSVAPMPAVASDGTVADVSVYAPPHVARGERFLVQVFAYDTDDDEDMIGAAATAVDFAAVRRGVATLNVEIAHGDRLDFTLDAFGLVIEDAQQSLIWRGKPRSCGFQVRVPDDFSGSATNMRVRVFRQAVPIGQISFSMRVTAMAAPEANEPTGDSARRFRRAFLSYTTCDRAEVVKRAQALRAAHVDFFNDLLSIEPGERWEQKLYSEIERCDLFLLFWSHAARESVWVNKEIDHALACLRQHGGDRPEILPIILEGPPPPKPPDSLADRQFNDPLLYVIAAVEKLEAIRPAN